MFSAAIALGAGDSVDHYRPLAVSADLRGFAADESQLRRRVNSNEEAVSITGCVSRKCPTGRDLYLDRRYKIDAPSWERTVVGRVVDGLLSDLHIAGLQHLEDAFEDSTRTSKNIDLVTLRDKILDHGRELVHSRMYEKWVYKGHNKALEKITLDDFANHVAGAEGPEIVEGTIAALNDLVRHETDALIDYLRRQQRHGNFWDRFRRAASRGRWMAETRAVLWRLQFEVKLDSDNGRANDLGLTTGVKPDILYAVTLVGDVKSGHFYEYYQGVATGYAIFVEYALKTRVNTAVIVVVELDWRAGKLDSLRIVPIKPTDDQRRKWVARRNDALRILSLPEPPAHPTDRSECHTCHFRAECWGGGTVGGEERNPPAPVKASGPPKKSGGGSERRKARKDNSGEVGAAATEGATELSTSVESTLDGPERAPSNGT
jgi:CRISPR/Cas system-associated exonuclease Cas4 (RecB family)